jgi:hypothetical protein
VHLEAAAGYRYGRTTDLTIAGQKALTASGDTFHLDWSGFMSRAGLSFYFGPTR